MATKQYSDKDLERRLRQTTVYPSDYVRRVLLHSCPHYNGALACWAKLIAEATDSNDRRFTPAEWDVLYELTDSFKWDPEVDDPGAQMASVMRRPSWLNVDPKQRSEIATKLEGMDYIDVWAVIWSCMAARRVEKKTGTTRPNRWWTLAARPDPRVLA